MNVRHLLLLVDDNADVVKATETLVGAWGFVQSDGRGTAQCFDGRDGGTWVLADIRGLSITGSPLTNALSSRQLETVSVVAVGEVREMGVPTFTARRFFRLRSPPVDGALAHGSGAGDAASGRTASQLSVAEPHSMTRWASLVLRTVQLPRDPKTLSEWGRSLGISRGALRNWCRTANLPAGQSLRFARMLRAVVRQDAAVSAPEDLLNVVDRRALRRLMILGGGAANRLPTSPTDFFARQRLIQNPVAIEVIAKALGSPKD